MSNVNCLKQFSHLIDSMLESEVNCLEGRCTSHQQRMIQNEMKFKFMFQLMDLLMEKLSVIEEKVFEECMTCEACSLSGFVLEKLLDDCRTDDQTK